MLRDLENQSAKILVVDHLDRLTRDEGDMAFIFKQLQFHGIALHSVAHGKVDRNTAAIMAIVGRSQLESTAHAVKRGQQGRIRAGKNAGGRPYGYCLVGRNGDLAPDIGDGMRVGEADVVRRIFKERLEGRSPRDIAARLNRDGIQAPRGDRWNASTLNGSRTRRNGILRNPIYGGTREWNRVKMTRHPVSGKRISRPNGEADVVRVEVPDLALVSKEDFGAVQQLFPQDRAERPEKFRRAKTILTGLLKCGCCGGGMSMKDKSRGRIRVQCSTMKESGSCDNRSSYYLDDLVEASLGGLKDRLTHPQALAVMVKAYNEERIKLAGDTAEKRRILGKKLEVLQTREKRIWDDYEGGLFDASIAGPRLAELKLQIQQLETEMGELPAIPVNVVLHPGSISAFAKHIDALLHSFEVQITDENREAAEAARTLIDKVVVTPSAMGTNVEIFGIVGHLIAATKNSRSGIEKMLGGTLVAEEGLEPPTRGL